MEFALSSGDYRSHQGIWSDGVPMWVSQYNEDLPSFDDTAERIVAYTAAPASPSAYLRALEVVDALLIPSNNRGITSYAAEAPDDATTATVVARSRDNFAEVSFTPADFDGADGHQVALSPGTTTHVTVTVTAADGAATKSYSLAITPCELRIGSFVAGLASRKEEVKRRCRTVLPSRAERLLRDSRSPSQTMANAHPTVALV